MKQFLFLLSAAVALWPTLQAHADSGWPETRGKVIAEEPLPPNAQLYFEGSDPVGDGDYHVWPFSEKYETPMAIKINPDGGYVIPAIDVDLPVAGDSVYLQVWGCSEASDCSALVYPFQSANYYGITDHQRFEDNVSSFTYRKIFHSTSVTFHWGDQTLDQYVDRVIKTHPELARQISEEKSGYTWGLFDFLSANELVTSGFTNPELPLDQPLGSGGFNTVGGGHDEMSLPDEGLTSEKIGRLKEYTIQKSDEAAFIPTSAVKSGRFLQFLDQNMLEIQICPKDSNRGCIANVVVANIAERPLMDSSNTVNIDFLEPSAITDIRF